ncbi:unnamed protein product [Microthlaspi erraticum]|uniref:Uncharacterized protein n=1 Tax=Microthlaspi erraticum TaxID=1685480 RepID=A0A6D2IID5_9BRAS|nr:unnamed protein product [Microthlaspi erraticum]
MCEIQSLVKRSYNQKSEDCPDGSIEKTAPKPRSPAGRETNVSRSAKVTSVRLKSRPKSKPTGRSRNATRETLSRGRPSFKRPRHAAHDQSARAGKQGLAAAQPVPRTTADASVRAGKERPTSGREFHRPNLNPLDHAGRPRIRPTPTVPTRPRSDCPADRPDRPSQRRGRPEALFEAQTYVFKPGLTLSRL